MDIYLSSSWKQRDRVRALAIRLRTLGHSVYDFTDPACRKTPEMPPERFPEQFNPDKHVYGEYLAATPEWRPHVFANQDAVKTCDLVVLLLPCGNDAHADAFYGLGLGKRLVVCGQPLKGDRTPTHLWADWIARDEAELMEWLGAQPSRVLRSREPSVKLARPEQADLLTAVLDKTD